MLCVLLRSFLPFTISFALFLSFPDPALTQNVLINGPALPLAVKSPYLNTWIPGGGLAPHTVLFNPGPTIWSTAVPPLDWSCSVCFWNTTNANVSPDCGNGMVVMKETTATSNEPPLLLSNITSVVLTPSRTSYLIQVGNAELNVTFLSPVTPKDLARQSLPFSYLYITTTSAPTAAPGGGVRVYTDITAAQWLSGEDVSANASSIIDKDLTILTSQLESPQSFVEIDERPQDGTVYYATNAASNVHYQVGQDVPVRTLAMNSTGLQDLVDQTYGSRPLNEPQVDVFGISFDQPNSGQGAVSSPFLWVVGLTRDPSIEFTFLNGSSQLRSSYFWSNFTTARDAISFVLDDFNNALDGAQAFDAQLLSAANVYSSEYADLVSLTTRQVMSALEYTVPLSSSGTFDLSDVKVFVKDLGSVASGGVNAVDVLYAALPLYIYLNAEIVGMVLRPLLEAQDDPLNTLPYAAQNLGTKFPTATVQNSQHNFGIEQSGNMLIMALAHAQATGDGSIIGQHYGLLKNWTEYLVENSLDPGSQQTSIADGILSSNQTNLALKGIIGIGAMARMSSFAGLKDDESRYQNISQSYMQQWLSLAVSSDKSHLLGNFGNETSSGVIYNLFADRLLQLELVPQTIYDIQTSFYESQLASLTFGLSLDSGNPTLGRVDWTMFAASVVSNADVRTQMIAQVHAYTWNAAIRSGPLSTVYDPTQGAPKGGSNSPALGAIFSLLALEKPIQNFTVQTGSGSSNGDGGGSNGNGDGGSSSSSAKDDKNTVGIAVGSVIGAVLAISPVIFYYFYRKRREASESLERRKSLRRMESLSVRTTAEQTTTAASSRSHLIAPQAQEEQPQRQQATPAGVMHADTKIMRAREQFVTFGLSEDSEGSSSRATRTEVFSTSSEAVESPTEDEDGVVSGSRVSYSPVQDAASPSSHRTSSEVWRMRGQLANLMREVARIRDERLSSGLRIVIPSGSLEMEAPPLYDEEPERSTGM